METKMTIIDTAKSTLTALTLMDSDTLLSGYGKLDKSERISTIGKIKLAIALNSKGDEIYSQFKELYNISRTWSSRALRCESVIKTIESANYNATEFSPSALFEMVDFDDVELIDYIENGTITPQTSIKELRELKKVIKDEPTEDAIEEETESVTVVDDANAHVELPTKQEPKDIVIPYELFINMFNQLKDDAVNTREKASKYLR